jgi:peptide-methionine (S)-S-oxide reductase
MDGVIRTRVGYAGGTSTDPTYYNLDGHTETVQVDYDPTKISYDELLDVFWNSHDPTAFAYSRQYQSIIFVHNEEQQRLADQSKQQEEAKLGSTVTTEIIPFTAFYPAEGWHQKYYLRQIPDLMADFKAMYPDAGNFRDSTAAARINGYIGGYGTAETLQKELASYGLSPTGNKTLLEYASAVPGICSVP